MKNYRISVRIWTYSGLYIPAFGLNTERYTVFIRIRENTDQNNSEYGHFLRSVINYNFCDFVSKSRHLLSDKVASKQHLLHTGFLEVMSS